MNNKNKNSGKKQGTSSKSTPNKRSKNDLNDLRKEKKELKLKNKRLKQRQRQLEEKIDNLKEENRKLLHRIEEEHGKKDEIGIRLPSDSVIKGDLESEKKIEVENEVRIVGSLKSDKDIILGYGNQIQGDVISKEGDVKAGNATEIGGVVKGQKIHLAEGVQAGQIKGEGKIILEDNCEVSDIFALGDVDIGENVKIDGTIRHAGDFSVSRGINVTDSIIPKSREELDKEAEEKMKSSLPFLPMIIREGFGETEDEEDEIQGIEREEKEREDIEREGKEREGKEREEREERDDKEIARDKINDIRTLIQSARDENIDISEEKSDLKEGISLFKRGKYAKADDRFAECKRSLEKKLNIEEETDIKSETDVGEIEENVVDERTDEADKEKIIKKFEQIRGVGPSLAEEIYASGFHSIEELKEASQSELLEIDGIGESFSKTIKENID